jgi:hypothetical protein
MFHNLTSFGPIFVGNTQNAGGVRALEDGGLWQLL